MKDPRKNIGKSFSRVTLELILDDNVTRPRVCPVDTFPREMRVEFPLALRSKPIGTRFVATVKVCQKHTGAIPKGPPYLRASEIQVVESSIPERGFKAKAKPGTTSGRSYVYEWSKSRKR
jgi:hypothetical protein